MKRTSVIGTTVLAAACALGFGLAPAQAASAPQHCVQNVDTGAVDCAGSEDAAMRAAGSLRKIGTIYDLANYQGASYTFAAGHDCTAGYDDEVGGRFTWTLNSWSNRATSIKTFNRCDAKLFDGPDFGGGSSTYIDAYPNLGTLGNGWNNRASSIKFS